MVGQMDISTPAGQQMLYDYVNWRLTGHKPIPGFGGASFRNSRQELYHAVTAGVFSNAAKKIAPVAVGKMTEEDFHLLLCVLDGRENRDLRRTLKQQRKDNPCDGSEIRAPFPVERQFLEGPDIDLLNVYTPSGRRLLLDFIDHENIGFHPAHEAGCDDHYRYRQEYVNAVTKDQFRSQAKKIAKVVLANVPCKEEMVEIFEAAERKVAQKQKAQSRMVSRDI